MKKLFLASCFMMPFIAMAQDYTVVDVQDSISANTHWTCDKQYLLKGYVYVTSGATLEIDPGTIIRGDKDTKGALIVERGARIKAMGTATSPVVFTSNQDAGDRNFGDWGGIILCGKAPTNWSAGQAQVEGGPRSFYGGTDPNDNSGEMHYVRIEFAGIAFSPNNEVNSLTFCGVGSGTQIDHIQCSYGGDDAFEFFGGTVNAKYLVSLATWDDDFDTDCGYQGKVQFGVVLRDPYNADNSGSKGFESDSYLAGTYSGTPVDNTKISRPVFSNCTAIGPLVSPSSTAFDPYFVAGAHIRRGSAISILNSVFMGWPCGVLIDESSSAFGSTTGNLTASPAELQLRNNIIAGVANAKNIFYVKDGARSLTPTTTWGDTTTGSPFGTYGGPIGFLYAGFGNKTYTNSSDVRLSNAFNLSNPSLVPTTTSPISFNSAHPFNVNNPINTDTTGAYANYNVPTVAPDFSTSKASDPWFTRTNYIGAFDGKNNTASNWMKGWCNFDPNNANYETTCYVAPDPTLEVASTAGKFDKAKVFPNPASDKAMLLLDVKQNTFVAITLSDVTGKIVKEIFKGSVGNGNQPFEFSTSELANGLYIITISSENKIKTLKLNVIK
jgi:hypothetical protein